MQEMWSVRDFLDQYDSINTIQSYTSSLLRYFSLIYPELDGIENYEEKINRLNELSITYFSENRDIRKDIIFFKNTLKDNSPKTRLSRLATVFRFFEDNGQTFPRNFVKNINGKATDAETDEHIPTAEETGRILEYLPIQAKTLTLVLVSSGMRDGEALKLTLEDLDLDRIPPRINIPAKITKTKKKRITFLTPEACDHVKEWLEFRQDFIKRSSKRGRAKRKAAANPNDNRVFPFSYDTYMFHWKESLKKAGLYEIDKSTRRIKLRPHNLRKFFSTYGKWTNPDIPDALQGHARGMRAVYNRYDKAVEILEEAYLKAQDSLSIYSHSKNVLELQKKVDQQSKDIQTLITNLSVENVRLKEQTTDLYEKLGSLEGLKERIEELEDYVEIDVLRKEAKRIRDTVSQG